MSAPAPTRPPTFFATFRAWNGWLAKHHAAADELWVGFHKKGSGKPSIDWPQSVDGALCWGWIDGIRRAWDATSFVIRFTPRRPRSIWSTRNTKRFAELESAGLVHAAGRKAFEARREDRSGIYSFEQRPPELPAAYAKVFRAQRAAWKYFQGEAPSYRRAATWWVVSAKQEATRERRLAALIADSAACRRIGPMRRATKA